MQDLVIQMQITQKYLNLSTNFKTQLKLQNRKIGCPQNFRFKLS